MSEQMNLNNEIKRLRNKLSIFGMDGSGQLMNELLNFKLNTRNVPNQELIRLLKAQYTKELDELLAKQNRYKQGKLDL